MSSSISGRSLVILVCGAQVLVQIGANFWPALLPGMMERWTLSNSEAGWITAIFFGAYMVSVPVLVTLTDRIDAKQVYLFGVGCTVIGHLLFGLLAQGFWSALALRALTGIGWAGTYMTGLKLLADKVDQKMMSRAVTGHVASIGVSGAFSYMVGDLIEAHLGWQAAFVISSITAASAWFVVAALVPAAAAPLRTAASPALFDFRPVLRNRSAMAYALAYCAHTLEMNTLRGWGVAFLAWVALQPGHAQTLLSPTTVITALGLIGTLASVAGNEASIRFGRRRLIVTAMLFSIVVGSMIGLVGSLSYAAATVLVIVYGVVILLDSSSLTAGTAGTAEPSRRGATLAVHSMLGYGGGFVGPIIVGNVLDWSGGMSVRAWWLGFGVVAVLMTVALAVFVHMQPRNIAGETD